MGGVLVGDVGVELHPRFMAVLQVHLTSELTPTTGLGILASGLGGKRDRWLIGLTWLHFGGGCVAKKR